MIISSIIPSKLLWHLRSKKIKIIWREYIRGSICSMLY